MGDASDNIPGVPGVGEKTATKIIQQYQTIENAYVHADELKPPRASKNLKEYWEQAKMSKALATIDIHADIDFDLDIRYTIYNSIRHCFGDESILVAQRLKESFFQTLFYSDASQ